MKNNVTYIWSAVVNNIARKVAAEPMENVDEEKVELIRELRKDLRFDLVRHRTIMIAESTYH